MHRIKQFLDLTHNTLQISDSYEQRTKLDDVLSYIVSVHYNHRDKDGSFFIFHPISVAEILIRSGKCNDLDTIYAALLHDVFEKVDVDTDFFKEKFGSSVFRLVDSLTKYNWLGSDEEIRTINYIGRIKEAGDQAVMIKLADRLDRINNISCRDREDGSRYISDTLKYYSSIAMNCSESAVRHIWDEILKSIKK